MTAPAQDRPRGIRWDPNQYLKFADHRLRPALELLDRIPLSSPSQVYDLGCGTGELTRIMAERWPHAIIHGLDSSKEMLEKAASATSQVHWTEGDLRHWQPA